MHLFLAECASGRTPDLWGNQSAGILQTWERGFLFCFYLKVLLNSRAAEGEFFDSCSLSMFDKMDFMSTELLSILIAEWKNGSIYWSICCLAVFHTKTAINIVKSCYAVAVHPFCMSSIPLPASIPPHLFLKAQVLCKRVFCTFKQNNSKCSECIYIYFFLIDLSQF